MTDREKVISHFQDAIEASGAGNRWRFVRVDMIEDAIALLREQEPVEPFARYDALRREFDCGVCGFLVGFENAFDDRRYRAKYCPECGKKVKWDEAD